jgi:hypothetical protein
MTSRTPPTTPPWGQPSRLSSDVGTRALRLFFAIITRWRRMAEGFFDEHRMESFHSATMGGTHLSASGLDGLTPRFAAWGRRGFAAPALATGRSEAGTSGGVSLAPALGLRLDSLPDPESSVASWRSRGRDWAPVPIRLRVRTLVRLAACVTTCAGPVAENISGLREKAGALWSCRLPIVAADWNMEPQRLAATGVMDRLDVGVATPRGATATCNSDMMLDYVLVGGPRFPVVQLRVDPSTHWRTHSSPPRGFHVPAGVMVRSLVVSQEVGSFCHQ